MEREEPSLAKERKLIELPIPRKSRMERLDPYAENPYTEIEEPSLANDLVLMEEPMLPKSSKESDEPICAIP